MDTYQERITELDNAIKLNPDKADAYYDRANFLSELVCNDEFESDNERDQLCIRIIDDLDKTLELNPKLTDAYYERAYYRYELHRYDKFESEEGRNLLCFQVIEDLDKAIELNPELDKAYYLRGMMYKNVENGDMAFADFSRMIDIDYNNAEAHCELGLLYFLRKEFDKAFDCLTIAIEQDPEMLVAYESRAQLRGIMEDYAGMNVDFEKILELSDHHAGEYYMRAIVYRDKKLYAEAFADFDKAIELDPTQKQFYLSKAKVYESQGDMEGYYSVLIDLVNNEHFVGNEVLRAGYYTNRGVERVTNENYEGAIEDFTKVIEDISKQPDYTPNLVENFMPIEAMAYNNRASAYKELGEYEKAIQDLKQAIEVESRTIKSKITKNAKSDINKTYKEMGVKISLMDRIKSWF